MDPVVVVGAGIAGAAAARELAAAGVPVQLRDRGRRPGGRMAVRTVDGRPVDTGASYLTVSDPAFEAVVADWRRRGLARPWTDVLHSSDDGGPLQSHQGTTRWAAEGGLRSLVEDLLVDVAVQQVTVQRVDLAGTGRDGLLVDGEPASAVVLAMPDPQARRLLGDGLAEEGDALDDPFEPVLALTAWWERRCWPDLDGVFVNADPELSFVADDGRRRGDGAPVLVAHSTPELAAEHLDAPDRAAPPMLAALRRVLGVPAEPAGRQVHRWTFARPARGHDSLYRLGPIPLGVCGDAWSDKPRVEAAWLSGTALGRELAHRLR